MAKRRVKIPQSMSSLQLLGLLALSLDAQLSGVGRAANEQPESESEDAARASPSR
jgi:hypothetical protein